MNLFKKKKKEPTILTRRFEEWAIYQVGYSTGTQMLLIQSVNNILRNCRIGNVTQKESENGKSVY